MKNFQGGLYALGPRRYATGGAVATTPWTGGQVLSTAPVVSPGTFGDYLNQYNQRLQDYNNTGLNVGGADALDTSTLARQSQLNPSVMSDDTSFAPVSYNGQNAYRHMQNIGGNQYQSTTYDSTGRVLDQRTGTYENPSSGWLADALMAATPYVVAAGNLYTAGSALAGAGAGEAAPAATSSGWGAEGVTTAGQYGGNTLATSGGLAGAGGAGGALGPVGVGDGSGYALGSQLGSAPEGLTSTQLDLGAGGSGAYNTAGYGGAFDPTLTSGVDLGSLGSIAPGGLTGVGAGGTVGDLLSQAGSGVSGSVGNFLKGIISDPSKLSALLGAINGIATNGQARYPVASVAQLRAGLTPNNYNSFSPTQQAAMGKFLSGNAFNARSPASISLPSISLPSPSDRVYAGGSPTFNETTGGSMATPPKFVMARGGLVQAGARTNPPQVRDTPQGGQSDHVPAMLSPGEYVFDADSVSALGDGDNDSGAQKLDQFRENLRAHKRSAPASSIPPKAKPIGSYLKK